MIGPATCFVISSMSASQAWRSSFSRSCLGLRVWCTVRTALNKGLFADSEKIEPPLVLLSIVDSEAPR